MKRRSFVVACLALATCRSEPKPTAPAREVVAVSQAMASGGSASLSSAPALHENTPSTGGIPNDDWVGVYEALPSCTGYEWTLKLRSSTQPELRARFGPPTKRDAYRVVERQGEFYAAIEEVYPTTDPKNLDVPIEEWTWVKGDCRLTVWFHRADGTWRALGDLLWHYADEF